MAGEVGPPSRFGRKSASVTTSEIPVVVFPPRIADANHNPAALHLFCAKQQLPPRVADVVVDEACQASRFAHGSRQKTPSTKGRVAERVRQLRRGMPRRLVAVSDFLLEEATPAIEFPRPGLLTRNQSLPSRTLANNTIRGSRRVQTIFFSGDTSRSQMPFPPLPCPR